MIIPKMPSGYFLMQESGHWCVLKDVDPYMKRLLSSKGDVLCFDYTTASLAKAAEYAQKHKDAGLKYDQEVTEVKS